MYYNLSKMHAFITQRLVPFSGSHRNNECIMKIHGIDSGRFAIKTIHATFSHSMRIFPTPSPYILYKITVSMWRVFGRLQNSKAKAIKLFCEET